MKTEFGVPVGPGVIAFGPSQLWIGALVLAAVQSSNLLVLSVGTFVTSIAHIGSIDAGYRHAFLLGAGEHSAVALICAPIQRVTGICAEERLNAAAILVSLPDPVFKGLRFKTKVVVCNCR